MFDFLKKKKAQNVITKELFGERILSRFILQSGTNCTDIFEALGEEPTFAHYLIYLQYLLYLSSKILEQKYSECEVDTIIDSAIDGLFDFMDCVPTHKKPEAKKTTKEHYFDFKETLELLCSNINDENTIHKISDDFIEYFQINHTSQNHFLIFTEFSLFVIHHTQDILNDNIQLV
ncbi:MAG: hypothetical protein IJP16_05100 [Clostridia bacterium]|nr:hypothetical protein [Clostridia bacterium]